MSSINTNTAAMTALKSLQATNSALQQTQQRISTGLRVNDASDNAAYWSIATTMRSDNKALGAVDDALGLGAAKLDVAYTGINSAIDVVDEIKSKLVAAREPGVDRDKIQSEIGELQNQLTSISGSASFSGENWLSFDGASQTKDVVASFNRDTSGNVSVGTISIDISAVKLIGDNGAGSPVNDGILNTANDYGSNAGNEIDISVMAIDISTTGLTDADINSAETGAGFTDILDEMISSVDSALSSMTTAASDLGATKGRIDMQKDFVGNLMDAIDRGVGTLVDADMTKESTRLSALQTQQALGTQALSIANSASQSILSLFR